MEKPIKSVDGWILFRLILDQEENNVKGLTGNSLILLSLIIGTVSKRMVQEEFRKPVTHYLSAGFVKRSFLDLRNAG